MLQSRLDILKPEWLDVVFADRNKAYGAYDLRKQNGKNTSWALLIGIIAFVFLISFQTILNFINGFIPKAQEKVKITHVVLTPAPPIDKTKPLPPPPDLPKPKVDQVKFPPPKVTPDNLVKEPPPTIVELEKAEPGQKNIKGDPDGTINIDEPPGNGIKDVTEDINNKIFTAVEKEPGFPGGETAFANYLTKNLHYPAIAKENNIQGKVFISFVVERDGSLTDVKVIRGIGSGCDDEATRVLKNSPKWKPGIQNGRPVRAAYTIPISFTLQAEDQ